MSIYPIILAAGKGTRMNSKLPKVLHSIGGRSMLEHVIEACQQLSTKRLAVVYGHGGELVRERIATDVVDWVFQEEQRGTGHAVSQAVPYITDDSFVIIATGDVPLIQAETLHKLANQLENAVLTVLTTIQPNPFGYGRIVRNSNDKIQSIVEEKDANEEQRKITEVNTGFIAARGKDIKRWLEKLEPNNTQGELYLTDCISLAVAEGGVVEATLCEDPLEVQGINNRQQQAELERHYQKKQAEKLMVAGVTLMDPMRIDVRGELSVGKDVLIDVNTVFVGNVSLGNNVVIEPNCMITNTTIDDNTIIKANSVLEQATIGKSCDIGPFARVRPETVLEAKAKVGNFVEIKKSVIGEGSKVSHLSYIGDTQMGKGVNIGAGTITCNYDGANKFRTTIGDDVFVGSDTQLVAPVTLADGTSVGAGSTITKDTPAGELTLSRSKQITIKGWKKPQKKENI